LIKSFFEIGICHEDEFDETQQLTEDLGKKYTRIVTINLETKNDKLLYSGCSLGYKTDANYLYRKTPPAKPDPYSLTLKPSKKGPVGLIDRFVKFCEMHPGTLANGIKDILSENKEKIVSDIEEQAEQITEKNEFYFLTVLIDGRSVGAFKEFRTAFLNEVQRLPNSRRGVCFLCGKETEVGARVSNIFKFATIDQPGFAHMMSNKSHDVTMPLCQDCFSKLALGKRIADDKLTLNFYDSQVYVLPRFAGNKIGKSQQFTENSLSALKNLTDSFRGEDGKYGKFEARLIKKLSKGDAYSTLNFVFFVKARRKDEVKVYLNIEDVPPSRLKAIAKTADDIEAELKPLDSPRIRFEILWKIFKGYAQLKKEHSENPVPPSDFLKSMMAIFKSTKADLNVFKKSSMRYFYSLKMNSKESEQKSVFFDRNSIVAMGYFLDRLNNPLKGGVLGLKKPKEELLEGYFERYPGFFANDDLKLTFVIGMIHALVVDIQKDQGYNGTADQRIKGYRMKPDDFKEHLTYLRDKYKHYSKKMANGSHIGFVEKLFELAGRYQLNAGMNWRSSLTDLNYAFLCGEASRNLLMSSPEKEVAGEATVEEEE
jgi:CRISPR-associated protein Csh1